LSYGRPDLEMGRTPRCSPPKGSAPVNVCSGPIFKREHRQHAPRYSSRPRVIPDGDRTRATKKPRARFRGRGLNPFRVQPTSSPFTPHLGPGLFGLAMER